MNSTAAKRTIVLVVEDEPILRLFAVDMVEDAGFEAVEATDSTHAIMILESRIDIRIVFADIAMPRGMDGIKLAALIRDRWPQIEVVLTSGKFQPPKEDLPARGVFFSKPYVERDVVATMHRMAA